jgi:molybdopterin-guanine dinucleotide biosynthesis protein A
VNGFVLAGGRSTRMGRDKALLTYAARPLIAHAVDLLKHAGLEPRIVGSRPDLASFGPVLEDLHSGCGPLGGMEAALAASESEWNIFVPVDLPLLPPAFLRYLMERAAITGASATIPTLGGRPEPLCAVYHRDLLSGITRALESGEYKVKRAIESAANASHAEIDLFGVEAVAATRADWPMEPPLYRWFQNMNTPADMALVS